ncbi:MAG: helix-turn-helix transcriptional regulator [Ruminococcus sp.]|nr:helix-turn-helix transcriptional regulator [Ruminococcus sp.]
MEVGKRIKALREMQGLTVNRLANMAGLSQSFLREIELGNKTPTVETLSYFCEALGVSLSEFFREEEYEINPMLKTAVSRFSNEQQLRLAEFLNSLCQ